MPETVSPAIAAKFRFRLPPDAGEKALIKATQESVYAPPARGNLIRALAVSILFHLFLFWPGTSLRETAMPPVPLIASLRPGAAAVAPAIVVAPAPAVAPHDNTPITKPQPRTQLRPQLEPVLTRRDPQVPDIPNSVRSTAAPKFDSRHDVIVTDAVPRIGARPIPDSPTDATTGSSTPVASALPPADGLNPDGLRAFRIALAAETQRFKHYPDRAIEGNWIGTTEMRISVTPGQTAPQAMVLKSSGYLLLDEAALEMMRKALPVTPIPLSLQDRAFTVDLPVVFDLPRDSIR
jgi:protein TonB